MRNEAVLHSHGSIVSLLFIMKVIYMNYSQRLYSTISCFLSHLNRYSFGGEFLYLIVNTYLDEISCFWHFTL